MTDKKIPSGIPDKFDLVGNVQPFAGNTIICPLANTFEELKQSRLSHLYTLLPPSSWHMTVFEGVVDSRRGKGQWPSDIAANASLAECIENFKKKLADFDLATDLPFHVKTAAIEFAGSLSGIRATLEPIPKDEKQLRGLRDRLSDSLKIRSKKHDTYGFHLSIAYMLRFPTDEQQTELREIFERYFEMVPKQTALEPPEFCTFEDMFAYHAVLL
ncbi:hypothetical protein LTR78_007343 [Recurvomyces mirabilis]|uniref:DUF1868 domain-containing protein n=1 Tax=Recurvomyces mirabilis TaxID=574656 RepID=A0AAE0WHG3_9PEZI|nr:hypothetical protein LTR78_007343 [Recurvomyces mirabilis]KAK5155070.1 hypothetical protein LTS14_006025 [Recurvomyces mirabilis]